MIRTGIGFDVHRLESGVPMWVAGLEFADEPAGLAGHSDGDVVCHAICDALFSASGLGDMGSNYGTSDPAWAGASGAAFLTETRRRLAAEGWRVVNVAVQLIGTRPRLAGRRAEAEQLLMQILDAPVALSATTTDGLGFTGRDEGVAAMASALVEKIDN